MGQARRSSKRRKRGPGERLDRRRLPRWLLVWLLSVGGCLGSEGGGPADDPDHENVGATPRRSPSPPEDLEPCRPGVARGLLPATDFRIDHVYAYQGVEVPLIRDGRAERRRIDVIQGRDLLVRVFVTPTTPLSTFGRERRAHLILHTAGAEPTVYEDVRLLRGASRRDRMETTFNFYVPGEELFGEQALAVELWELGFCSGRTDSAPNRVPAEPNPLPLRTRATGPVRVRIVPIRFDGDGSGRMPDYSAEHLSEFASLLVAIFPITHVEMSVREPVGTSASDLVDILNQLLQLRSLESPPNDVSYYGIVEPAESMVDYCRFGCVAGVATFGATSGAGAVGVGIGYRGVASETFVHEMGHVYRLMHAPCGGPAGTDPHFPYPNAALGSWGYDARSGELIDPTGDRHDFMSYCDPAWISDYNYRSLIDRLSIVNGTHATDRNAGASSRIRKDQSTWLGASLWSLEATPFAMHWTEPTETLAAKSPWERIEPASEQVVREGLAEAAQASDEVRVFRTLRLDGAGRARWGVPIVAREDPGERVNAHVLDAAGAVVAATEVYRRDLSEQQGTFFFVPQPEVGWSALVIEGLAPQPFSASGDLAAFVP